jgi:hypothetical protein
MDIKCKTCDIRTWKKHLFLDISSICHFTSALKPHNIKSFNFCLGHFRTSVFHVSWPSCEPLCATNTSHHKQGTFLYEYPLHLVLLPTRNAHQNTALIGSTLLKNGCHLDYWNQLLNMRMHVCYLDCYEAVLCCYLVIHIENLLHPLQLFYFHCDLFTDSPS